MAKRPKDTQEIAAPPVIQATGESGNYQHPNQAVQRPAVGVQQEFPDRRPPKEYRYDSSLAPELCWDEHAERDLAEWLLGLIEGATQAIIAGARRGEAAQAEAAFFAATPAWAGSGERFGSLAECVARLKSLTRPFLNWTGKAERQAIRVPTIPLFVHERHSTQAILKTLEGYKAAGSQLDLFGDPQLDVADQLDAYEHLGPWSNRLVLGDSLQVMNSLLELRGPGRSGPDDLHGPALWGEIRLQLPALRAQARREARPGPGHDPRAGDGQGVPRHLGAGAALLSELPARPAAAGQGVADREREHLCADFR